MGGLNKQGEEKNRVPDTAHDCPILCIGVMHEQPVSERENLSKWELFSFFHSLSLHHKNHCHLYFGLIMQWGNVAWLVSV